MSLVCALDARRGHGSGVPESTPTQDSAFFFRVRKEKPDLESLFNFGSSRSLRCHFLSKNIGKFRLDR